MPPPSPASPPRATGLAREMGLLGLLATGICAMIGAAINIIPFTIQRNVPGIGPWVLLTFAAAAVPAVLAGFAYAILASAMPRAGGSYVFASRGASPYIGFVASFSQWFGICIAIGVVSYVLPPFLRDTAVAAGWSGVASALESRTVRLTVALVFLWTAVIINMRGIRTYQRIVVPLMFLTIVLGGTVIVAGFMYSHADFAAALLAREGRALPAMASPPFSLSTFLPAAALLFSSFIGFDSIAQAGGEARNPARNLPLSIGLAVAIVGVFYMLFTAAVYHAVPWEYVAEQALKHDVTAPGLLGILLPPAATVVMVSGASVALAKDLPPMLLGVSRLMFAWAEDGIFPAAIARVDSARHTPNVAIVASAGMATVGILGSHFAGDIFLGIDILLTSMLVNFLLMCITVVTLPVRNLGLARDIRVLPNRGMQLTVAWGGIVLLGALLALQAWKDLTATVDAWYFRSILVWLAVMAVGTVIYLRETAALRKAGVDLDARFSTLPPE
ncbi:MAG: APC family permease [Gemmatimonadaceae bacterium]